MIKDLLKGFIQRDGIYVMFATLSGRLLSFFALWIALKLISNYELGLVIYAQSLLAMLIPLSGFGAMQGLLRFGALSNEIFTQKKLFWYTLYKGLTFSILIIFIIIIFSKFFTAKLQDARPFLIALSFQLISLFLLENLKTYFRVIHQNKKYAQTEISYNLLLVIFVFLGSFFFKETGYTLALILTPLIVFIFFIPGIKSQFIKKLPVKTTLRKFWTYSFFAGLSNVTAQLLIVLDIILIGNILGSPEKVTLYKYISLIPFSLLFLPRILLMTDFVNLTQKYREKDFIQNYIYSYILLFGSLSLIFLVLGWILGSQILSLFGDSFIAYKKVFITILFGISGILTLRGLFGNLLSIIGKAHLNFWISIIGITINLIANYILIPHYGIMGAAITSTVVMWLTSLISMIIFIFLYKREVRT